MAGLPGGLGIANVDTLEELSAMTLKMSLGPFSETEVIPLVDLVEHLNSSKRTAQAMMPGGGGR